MDTTTDAPPITTALGTPASPKWDADWLAEVDRTETELGHRICGAHTPAWTPCKLTSTHPNGRCRFHGGHPGIGAPDGNRNAWVHGLYSRRLQQCGDHCPLWNHCPMAGKDVLDLTPKERPLCVYEKEEFESLLHDLSESVTSATTTSSTQSTRSNDSDSSALREPLPPREPDGLIQRNIALFQVMLSRAQAALGIARLTDETTAYTLNTNYRMRSVKPSALVQAQLHIARELRQWLKLLPGFDPRAAQAGRGTPKPMPPDNPKGLPMRMLDVLQETEGFLELALGLPPGEKSAFSPRLPKRNPPPDASPMPTV